MKKVPTIFFALFLSYFPHVNAVDVDVVQSTSGWKLLVDGQPYTIKGVGCNAMKGEDGEDYLLMAKEMGANSVRTWGEPSEAYLDRAHELGLSVNAGIWFNAIRNNNRNSYQDSSYREQLTKTTLRIVRKLKNHPALLMWNLGNEVFCHSENEEERVAFGKFLTTLVDQVHEEDPHHPITYASSSRCDFPYLKKYVPNIDIVGTNTYSNYLAMGHWLENNDFNKPLIASEFGPRGAWDLQKDPNNHAYDPFDHLKARNYEELWKQIFSAKNSLGGYAFVLGDQRNQDSLTWWNVNYGENKRQQYWMLYELYTGNKPKNFPPKIKSVRLSKIKNISSNEKIDLEFLVDDPEEDKLSFDFFITDIKSDPLDMEDVNFIPTQIKKIKDGHVWLKAPSETGIYRVYVKAMDTKGNIAIVNRTISVD